MILFSVNIKILGSWNFDIDSKEMGIWLIILAILFIAGTAWTATKKFKAKTLKISNDRKMYLKRASKLQDRKNIFVMLSMQNSETDLMIVEYLKYLYDVSYLPQRIHVAVCLPSEKKNSNLEDQLLKLEQDKTEHFQFRRNIALYFLEPSEIQQGYSYNRSFIWQHCKQQLKNEFIWKYFFMLSSENIVTKNWDEILVNSLHKASIYGGHLLTQLPGVKTDNKPTYAILDHQATLRHKIPIFQSRQYKQIGNLYESLMCHSSCLFGYIKFLYSAGLHNSSLLNYPIGQLSQSEDDFLLSVLCFNQGLRFFNPSQNVCYPLYPQKKTIQPHSLWVSKILEADPAAEDTTDASEYLKLLKTVYDPTAYLNWIGVDLKNNHILGRASLGITDSDCSDIEIVHKYGSKSKFQEYRKMLCFD